MNLNKILLATFLIFILSVGTCFASDLQDGIRAYNNRNYAVAQTKFKNALAYDPNNVNVRYYLAISLVQLRRYQEARMQYQYIINMAPYSNAAYWAKVGLKMLNNGGPKVQSPVTRVVLNIEELNSVIIVKNVNINNKINANFILDTGATLTVISPELANKLGLNLFSAKRIALMTANGGMTAPKTTLNSIEISGLTAKYVDVAVANISTDSNLQGLLGMSFLKNFKVTIDKSAGKVILEKY